MYYIDDIVSKTYSLNVLLEDLLLQTPLVTVSLHLRRWFRLVTTL